MEPSNQRCNLILEQAVLSVTPGAEQQFEAAVQQAKEVIAQARGFRSLRLQRGVERPSTYLLLNEWDTVEDHMVGFRESELFVRWRELIGPYFAAPPEVEHFDSAVITR
jgi:heme-degrading monooxygenase HmoA